MERNNPLSKAYHNTTARYNGYFLAKEKMHAIEAGLRAQMQYDYSQVLPLYPAIDSLTAKAAAAELEDVVKKASFPIQYHKNSKWIDDSYVLIGKARFYQLDFADASRTFKYANSISKDPDAQHEALVWLMRTFMAEGQMDNAHQVSEHLRKERLNKDNARELYLARAHYHQLLGDTAAVIENLALSIPNFGDKDKQSQVRFTLAQLYQLTNQKKEAYEQYTTILRRNPPYDISFFSRLYLGQVSELSDADDTERIAGYYEKMLKDDKNIEYRDKILYEMAQFELRQQHYDKALTHLQQSLRTEGTLPNQKAYSHLLAGEIYFDNLGKYNLAQAHYDSALQVLPLTAQNYEAVAERRDVLTDFATHYTTIQTQDSLQRLARMSEADRMAFLQQLATQEDEQRQQEMAVQQEPGNADSPMRTATQNRSATAFATNTSSSGVWYFDNPSALASARSEFIRRWGDRPLQDFWRTRARGEGTGQPQVAQATVTTAAVADSVVSSEDFINSSVQRYMENIPLTTAAIQASEKQVEEALFRLGNIYNQNLKEPVKAAETFETLLERFPETEHAAEAYYSLYLLYDKAKDDRRQVYYNKIKQQYPNSTFAQLLDDADFMSKNAADNLKAHTLYDAAYTHYETLEYKQAKDLINQLVSQYPLNDIKDKVAFLEVLVTARTEKPDAMRIQLNRFKADFPTSPLMPQVDQLIAAYTDLENKSMLRTGAATAIPPQNAVAYNAPALPDAKISTEVAPVPKPNQPQQKDTTQLPAQPIQKEEPKIETTASKAVETGTIIDLPEPDSTTTPAVAADPLAYNTAADSAYYFVLIYPANEAAFKDIAAKYARYNQTFYRNLNLNVSPETFSDTQGMLVLQSFKDIKTARAFNVKQKAPQAPVGKIRGVDFITFVISSANYKKLMQKKNLEDYLTFFKNNS